MSLLTSAVYPALAGIPAPREATGAYTLRHDGASWALLSRRAGSTCTWSTPLAAHGAAPGVSDRVARAVAVRVLHELEVEVAGWTPSPAPDGGQTPEARAVLAIPGPRRPPRRLQGH